MDVEQERGSSAVADSDLQVGAYRFVDLLDLLQGRELLVEAAADAVAVVGGDQQQGIGAQAVAPCTPGLLIVALQRVAQGVMHDEAHVGLVDAHAECVRGHHHARFSREPLFLSQRPFGMPEPAVVGCGRNALPLEEVCDLLRALARAHVDDSRAGDVAHQTQQLSLFVIRMADAV